MSVFQQQKSVMRRSSGAVALLRRSIKTLFFVGLPRRSLVLDAAVPSNTALFASLQLLGRKSPAAVIASACIVLDLSLGIQRGQVVCRLGRQIFEMLFKVLGAQNVTEPRHIESDFFRSRFEFGAVCELSFVEEKCYEM